MEIKKPDPVDWSNLPRNWSRVMDFPERIGSCDAGSLIFKNPHNGVELLTIPYSDECFASILSPRQAHAAMMAVANLFEDCKTAPESEQP